MNKRFFFVTGAIAALIWSTVMVYFYASGRINSYVRDIFQEQALIGGIVLAIVALFNLLNISEKVSCGHDHDHKDGESCDNDHSHGDHDHEEAAIHSHHHEQETASGMAINFSILLIPVILAAILTPDAYSAAHVKNNMTGQTAGDSGSKLSLTSRKPSDEKPAEQTPSPNSNEQQNPAPADPYAFTEADLDNLVSKNEAGEYVITVPEIFYTGGDEALQAVLSGKPVETTGQAMEENNDNAGGKRMRIFRLYMECCAADARPISVPVEFPDGLPEFKEMRWYNVHGTMSFEQLNGYTVPVIKATKLIETEPEDGSQFYDKSAPN